jgi:hypothetical protein
VCVCVCTLERAALERHLPGGVGPVGLHVRVAEAGAVGVGAGVLVARVHAQALAQVAPEGVWITACAIGAVSDTAAAAAANAAAAAATAATAHVVAGTGQPSSSSSSSSSVAAAAVVVEGGVGWALLPPPALVLVRATGTHRATWPAARPGTHGPERYTRNTHIHTYRHPRKGRCTHAHSADADMHLHVALAAWVDRPLVHFLAAGVLAPAVGAGAHAGLCRTLQPPAPADGKCATTPMPIDARLVRSAGAPEGASAMLDAPAVTWPTQGRTYALEQRTLCND